MALFNRLDGHVCLELGTELSSFSLIIYVKCKLSFFNQAIGLVLGSITLFLPFVLLGQFFDCICR